MKITIKRAMVFILLIAGLLSPVGLAAQMVYKDSNNRVILDITNMAAGMRTNVKKYTAGPYNTTTVTNGAYIGGNSTISITENMVAYEKLEIAPRDMHGSGLGPGTTQNWQTSFLACKNLAYDGGGWRLPTQREWMLMIVFAPALDQIFISMGNSGSTALPFIITTAHGFWTATETGGDQVISADPVTGMVASGTKNSSLGRARCVREVTTP